MAIFKPMAVDAGLIAMLQRVGLPTDDLCAQGPATFCGMWEDDQLCGVVAVESYGCVGLLRSLAVTPSFRGRGLGRVLVSKAEDLACQAGIDELYLLTISSSALFERCGFVHVLRGDVPAPIRETKQFSSLCPSTCAVMRKKLQNVRLAAGVAP
ncbi:GNAT family N-acetyltransferase [Stenotrophomonas sp. ISL-67]|uniref:arsenic resistance N-acetyltransferase ArsN2 n=1 Tax=Stenotrophomonas sp. ISL-67 TaxID=2819171 RepID=UPI001BE7650D|nr:arsenic resistance N-acetyltransferase ArsN2 [Stenotrophomonas sp. ISL-67]MBT2767807.1 GNAT family N-acetyltransferase [Stenotrophomonas sp. ISL-67]